MIEQIRIESSMKIQEYENQLSQLTERIEQISSDVEIDNIVEESKAVLKQIEEEYCAHISFIGQNILC
jgi:sugar-specific transcriptional regulator TrmB